MLLRAKKTLKWKMCVGGRYFFFLSPYALPPKGALGYGAVVVGILL